MVDTTLDKLILQSIQESTEIIIPAVLNSHDVVVTPAVLLPSIPSYFIGDKNMQGKPKRIVFARTNNVNNGDGFEFTDRKVSFSFHLQILETIDYLGAMDLLNAIENALIRTLVDEEGLLQNYNSTMSIENITPVYISENDTMEDIIFWTEEVVVSFDVDEDYSTAESGFGTVIIRGEVQDGN